MLTCAKCEKVLSTQSVLNRHLREVHKEVPSKSCPANLKCPSCQMAHQSTQHLIHHLEDEHNFKSCNEQIIFKTVREFKDWKRCLEIENQAQFVVRSSRKGSTYYRCNRSGSYRTNISPENRKRKLKTQGSRKIESHCPASITAKVLPDGSVDVTAEKSHFGHEKELVHIPLPSPVKKVRATRISSKIVPDHIYGIQERLTDSELEPEALEIIETVSKKSSQLKLAKAREENMELATTVLSMISTAEEAAILDQALKSALCSIKAARQTVSLKSPRKVVSVRRKIDPQRKFVVKKMGNKKKERHLFKTSHTGTNENRWYAPIDQSEYFSRKQYPVSISLTPTSCNGNCD